VHYFSNKFSKITKRWKLSVPSATERPSALLFNVTCNEQVFSSKPWK